jgi:hypothetical protein
MQYDEGVIAIVITTLMVYAHLSERPWIEGFVAAMLFGVSHGVGAFFEVSNSLVLDLLYHYSWIDLPVYDGSAFSCM